MASDSLISRLYRERALYEAARIIGYGGVEPFAFFDKAKENGLIKDLAKQAGITEEKAKHKLLMAVYDLTRADRREASPPRYELTAEARKASFQLLGPPPDHEFHDAIKHGPPNLLSEAEARRWQDEFRRRQQANANQPAESQDQAEPEKKTKRKGRAR